MKPEGSLPFSQESVASVMN